MTGAISRTLELERASQCDITQFGVLASLRVENDTDFTLSTFRLAIQLPVRTAPPAAGDRYRLDGTSGRVAFDGVGYTSQGAESCDAVVTGYANDGDRASIVIELEGCALAKDERRIAIGGEVGCSGAGFVPIDLGFPDDAGAFDTDGGGSGEPDAGPPSDPCAGTCGESDVCVAGSCVSRRGQFQGSSCTTPTAACDAGEDGDCADGRACVDNACRRLTCQYQSSSCTTPAAPCAAADDCADGHACVENICRRLTCQYQSSSCTPAAAPCAADDDCADGHACVANICRRLTCQYQSSSCTTPTAPCATADDCAAGHVCRDATCQRPSCG